LLIEAGLNAMLGRARAWSESSALVIGVLFACTLPPLTPWQIVMVGAALAVGIGQALVGGLGNYMWHPVAVARVLIQIIFHDRMSPAEWPVLARDHLVSGTLSGAEPSTPLASWLARSALEDTQAWETSRPVANLLGILPVESGHDPGQAMAILVRDAMPPWPHTLVGVSGGAVGEACVLAIILTGLWLAWRGFLRWQMALAAVAGAAVAAIACPVQVVAPDQPIAWLTFPGLATHEGLPVGMAYVWYHLTAGAFLFVVVLLATDPSSSPLTSNGHLIYGLIIGVLTIVFRVALGIPIAAYWALLAANTCVPTIDRLTRRRVLGT
jgi:electron transport complex protein RnfD